MITHTEVFAPWAVMSFLYYSYGNEELSPKTYWSKTGYKTILERLFTQEKCKDGSLSKKFLEISENTTYELKFDNQISLFKYDWYSDIDNEAFFSHILLNSGYLAGKEDDGTFKLSIPNRELLKEFTNLLESTKENKDCGKILENLQKNRQLEILDMIKKDDPSEDFIDNFKGKFHAYKLHCADSSMNFNFISLAIIYDNDELYKALKNHCPEDTIDAANDFTALDYSSILQRKFVDDAINVTQLYYHNVNNKLYDLTCGALTNYYSGTVISTTPGWIAMVVIRSIPTLFTDNRTANFFEQHTTIAKCAAPLLALLIMTASKVLSDNLPTTKCCKEYTDYQKINITKPDEFTKLKHAEKYMQYYQDIYIVIDSECSEKDDKVTEIIQPVFKNPYVINENIKFTLCKTKPSTQEKPPCYTIAAYNQQCAITDSPQQESVNSEVVEQKELEQSEAAQPDEL